MFHPPHQHQNLTFDGGERNEDGNEPIDSRSSSSNRLLASKLGHSLLEVRERALDNISSKLESGLMNEADLVHSQAILQNLLSWFSHEHISRETTVLQMLLRISSHPNGARRLISFGALHILQELRTRAPTILQRHLDEVLRALFAATSAAEIPMLVPKPEDCHLQHLNQSSSVQSLARVPEVPADVKEVSVENPSAKSLDITNLCDRRITSWRFPIVCLVRGDERHLFDMALRLKVDDARMVEGTLLDLYRDALDDFPGEVFLQRPQVLLSLLEFVASPDDSGFDELVSSCLAKMARRVLCSVKLYSDEQARVPESRQEEFEEAAGAAAGFQMEEIQYPPPGGGRGRDRGSGAVQGGLSLRNNLSPEFFASVLILRILPTLKSDTKIASYAPVLHAVLPLQFEDPDPDDDLVRRYEAQLQASAEVIRFHMISCEVSVQFLLLLDFVLDLMSRISPFKADVPSDLVQDLGALLCNERLGHSRPDIRDRLLSALKDVGDSSASQDFARARVIIASMDRLDELSEADTNLRLQIISDSLNGLGFRRDKLPSVLLCVLDCFIETARSPQDDPERTKCLDTLVSMMSHWMGWVRVSVYRQLVDLVMMLSEQPVSTDDKLIPYWFLVHPKFLREVIFGGFCDKVAQAASLSRELLVRSCSAFPDRYPLALHTFRGLLELYGSVDSSTSGLSALMHESLTEEERIFSCIRHLFHRDPGFRQKAAKELLPMASHLFASLGSSEDQNARFEDLSNRQRDPFGFEPSAQISSSESAPKFFKEDDVHNLVSIYSNFELDHTLRRSAAEQLSMIFVDDRFHHELMTPSMIACFCEQVKRCVHDLVIPSVSDEPKSMLYFTLRLLSLSQRVAFVMGIQDSASLPIDVIIALLLPFVFHINRDVRAMVAELLCLGVFHPHTLGLTSQLGPVSSEHPLRIRFPVPPLLMDLFQFPFSNVELCEIVPRCRRDQVQGEHIVKMIEDHLALQRSLAADAHTSPECNSDPLQREAIVLSYIARISSAGSYQQMVSSTQMLRALCQTDKETAAVFRAADWSQALNRFFEVAPSSRQDDYAVSVLLSLISAAPDQESATKALTLISNGLLVHLQSRLEHESTPPMSLPDVLANSLAEALEHLTPFATQEAVMKIYPDVLALLTSPGLQSGVIAPVLRSLSSFGECASRDAAHLLRLCSALLSDNRIPNSFIGRSRDRAATDLVVRLIPMTPSACLADSLVFEESLRWCFRLLTDRESIQRARGLSILARAVQIPALSDSVVASSNPATSLADTAFRLAMDKTMAPVVRAAALRFVAVDTSQAPEECLKNVQTLLSSPNSLKCCTVMTAAIALLLLRMLEVSSRSDLLGVMLATTSFRTLLDMLSAVSVDLHSRLAALRVTTLMANLAPDAESLLSYKPLVDSIVCVLEHIFNVVESDEAMSKAIVSPLSFLLQVARTHVHLLPSSIIFRSVSIAFKDRSLRAVVCELVGRISVSKEQLSGADPFLLAEAATTLVSGLLRSQSEQVFFYANEPGDDFGADQDGVSERSRIARSLALLMGSANVPSKNALTNPLRMLVEQASSLHSLCLARKLQNRDNSFVIAELDLVLQTLQGAMFESPEALKHAFLSCNGPDLILRCFRLHGGNDFHARVLSCACNAARDCSAIRTALAGESKRDRRVGLLAAVAVNASTPLDYAILRVFACDDLTLPTLLRSGAVERALQACKARRPRASPLRFLACVALSDAGRSRLVPLILPTEIERFLDLFSSKSTSVRIAAHRLLFHLSFHGSSKVALLRKSIPALLESLLRGASSSSTENRNCARDLESKLASATLWSLVYDCQKATVILRRKLDDTRFDLAALLSKHAPPVQHNLTQMRALLNT